MNNTFMTLVEESNSDMAKQQNQSGLVSYISVVLDFPACHVFLHDGLLMHHVSEGPANEPLLPTPTCLDYSLYYVLVSHLLRFRSSHRVTHPHNRMQF